ncbi:MAG: hypothetical protein ACYC6P_02100 [Ignavibacteriaceae bacterium]|jgi:hypothetical protein
MKFYILILAIFLSGCDLFTTRTAAPPNQPRSNYQQAVTPDILIQNLVSSLADKNVENYLSCFADPAYSQKVFTFSASSSALSQFPALSENWGIKNEEQYFNNMILKVPDNLQISLTLSNTSTSPQGDSLFYTASYFLNVPTGDPNFPPNYQGDLKFSMIRDSRSLWTIYYWQDSKNSTLPSWSELKGRTY